MDNATSLEREYVLPFGMATPIGELTFYTLEFPQREIRHKFEYVSSDDWAFDGDYIRVIETLSDPMAGIRVHYISRRTGLEERVESPGTPTAVVAAYKSLRALRLGSA